MVVFDGLVSMNRNIHYELEDWLGIHAILLGSGVKYCDPRQLPYIRTATGWVELSEYWARVGWAELENANTFLVLSPVKK